MVEVKGRPRPAVPRQANRSSDTLRRLAPPMRLEKQSRRRLLERIAPLSQRLDPITAHDTRLHNARPCVRGRDRCTAPHARRSHRRGDHAVIMRSRNTRSAALRSAPGRGSMLFRMCSAASAST